MTGKLSPASSSSSLPTNSHVSTLAWNQRAQRRRKRTTGTTADARTRRLFAGFVACLVGLVLIVVHVELSMLHKANINNNTNSNNMALEPGRRIMSSLQKKSKHPHPHANQKYEAVPAKEKQEDIKEAREDEKQKKKIPHSKTLPQEGKEDVKAKMTEKAQTERREEEETDKGEKQQQNNNNVAKNLANQVVQEEHKDGGEKEEGHQQAQPKEAAAAAAVKTSKKRTIKLTKEEHDNNNNNNNNANSNNSNNLNMEDHSDLKDLIARTEQKMSTGPLPKTTDFCQPHEELFHQTDAAASDAKTPAVIILGMEDTSTNLLWHVLSHIMPTAGSIVEPSHPSTNQQSPSQRPYNVLKEMDPLREEDFWERLPLSDRGQWLTQALCDQQTQAYQVQQHSSMLGVQWLTLGDMSKNGQAIATLQAIAKLPNKDSIKIIRYRRNVLDMISRQEQHLMNVKENRPQEDSMHSVTLDRKALLKSMTHWNARQKAVDKFLEEANIPHLTIDHESLFPFNEWKDLANVTNIVQKYQVPLNVKIDFSRIAPDERPPEPSKMELEWTHLLEYLHIKHPPVTLYDIFSATLTFPLKGMVFWRQQQAITNYAAVQQILTGTHFQDLLRNLEYRHDFFGCACNDKEANRARMWKTYKNHHGGGGVVAAKVHNNNSNNNDKEKQEVGL